MSEPFFDFLRTHRQTVSNEFYGHIDEPKRYPRHSSIPLPVPNKLSAQYSDLLLKRRSTRLFSDASMTSQQISDLLHYSIAQHADSLGLKQFPFPSGGGFYPVETYLFIDNVSDLSAGVYHYSAHMHVLTKLNDHTLSLSEINRQYGCVFESKPHMLLQMTLQKNRCIKKYGSLIYPLYLMEAGHRGQNICLSAAAHNLGCCPMGGGVYEDINQMLDVDGVNEHYIYGIAIGIPS